MITGLVPSAFQILGIYRSRKIWRIRYLQYQVSQWHARTSTYLWNSRWRLRFWIFEPGAVNRWKGRGQPSEERIVFFKNLWYKYEDFRLDARFVTSSQFINRLNIELILKNVGPIRSPASVNLIGCGICCVFHLKVVPQLKRPTRKLRILRVWNNFGFLSRSHKNIKHIYLLNFGKAPFLAPVRFVIVFPPRIQSRITPPSQAPAIGMVNYLCTGTIPDRAAMFAIEGSMVISRTGALPNPPQQNVHHKIKKDGYLFAGPFWQQDVVSPCKFCDFLANFIWLNKVAFTNTHILHIDFSLWFCSFKKNPTQRTFIIMSIVIFQIDQAIFFIKKTRWVSPQRWKWSFFGRSFSGVHNSQSICADGVIDQHHHEAFSKKNISRN